ncbi:hypothetical protein [Paenibacillus sp. 1P07SE]|uniref:hypothetical protein n=1 Tax=Paenibacillus sp. 1P07SE TaxID=3132209 RepID=UPI0039A55A0E
MFKTLAISSLAAVTIAGASLSPDAGTVSWKPAEALSSGIAASAPVVQLADPLELAATYAQETLADWKATLAQYDEALKSSLKGVDLVQGELVEGELLITTGDSESVRAIPAGELDLKEGVSLQMTEGGTLSITRINLDDIEPIQWAELDESEGGVTSAFMPAFAATSASSTALALFETRVHLDEIAQSGDASAIKSALADLLDLYKQEIVHLTAE